jgi:hypothetical protein
MWLPLPPQAGSPRWGLPTSSSQSGIIPFSVKNSLNGKGDFGARLGGGGQLAGSVAAQKERVYAAKWY